MGFTGFTVVMPFLPLYIRQLGVTDVGQIALWSGVSLGVTPAVTAVLSPFWGRVADRYGRKLMVQRALICFTATMIVMGWVTRPWHILALRAFQGLFAGYGGLTMAMAAESAPRDQMARALGLVQTAQRIGPALGPMIGGAVAGLVGLRAAFVVTSAFYLLALALISFLYRDPRGVRQAAPVAADRADGWRALARSPRFLAMMTAIFVLTFVDRSFGPMLPLWIEHVGVPADRLAVAAGIVFSAAALGAAAGNTVCEVLLRRHPGARVIGTSTLAAAGLLALLFVAPPVAWMAAAMALFGIAVGVATTAAYTEGGQQVPPAVHGEGFGILNACALAGLALSPVVAGLLSKGALAWVFGIDLILLALLPLFLRRH